MKLLVSIHDVTPVHAHAVHWLWDVCARRGITPALLVVPSWHGGWRIEEHPHFTAWLRDAQALGAEIFLHGERHDEFGAPRGWRDELRAVGRTDAEGEFLSLEHTAARNRIARGLQRLRAVGLRPVGFVAPAWLARPGCHDVVAALGLHYSEDVSFIYLHGSGRRIRAPVVRWSARNALRARISVAVAAVVSSLARSSSVRVALHPADLTSARVRDSVLRTLDRFLARARPASYCAI